MKKGIFSVAAMLAILLLWAWPLFPAQSDPFPDQSEQEVYNRNGDYLGTIKKLSGRLVFFDKNSITLEKKGKDLWKLYNRKHQYMGKLSGEGESVRFRLYDKSGKFTGFIINVNERGLNPSIVPAGKTDITFRDEYIYVSTVTNALKIEPEEARLYRYLMEAIK